MVIAIIVVGGVFFIFRNRKSKKKSVASKDKSSAALAYSSQTSGVLSSQGMQRLEQLKNMLDKGLITQQDYDEQKKKLLGKT